MTRIKRGNVARKRRNKVLKSTRGFRGSSSKLFRQANQQRMKALRYTYRHRRERKRDQRRLWINRINAAVRHHGWNYSQFMHILKHSKILLNRKWISQIALRDSKSLDQLMFLLCTEHQSKQDTLSS
jgi:large subunit ribosomal protein L20